jgi:hypothetical protein
MSNEHNEATPITVAKIIGELEIPPLGGKMLREQITLPDGSYLVVRISRRHGRPRLADD